eukprot:5590706-Pyramimonas_sp.AAC.1
MAAAALYNAPDLRACHGRSDTHDVQESTYKRPHHHFGRAPIVLHLGDFLQLKPTGSIGLSARPDGDGGIRTWGDEYMVPFCWRTMCTFSAGCKCKLYLLPPR